MSNAENFLSLKDISFAYNANQNQIIKDFTFNIPFGSATALLGLNGTGKTTLLLLLLGYIKPEKGTIGIIKNGQRNSCASANGIIGYLSQNENIQFDYLVKDFILLGRAPHILKFSTPSIYDIDFVHELMESLNLSSLSKCKLGEISGGELQRVRIARTLAQEPDIILMDEPMTHLDIKNKKYLNNLITELKVSGKTIIYSTHDPLDVLNYSDNCIIMGKNHQYKAGETESLITSDVLSEFFEMPISVIKDNGNKSIVIH
jgi:iron complex transport system ATP-binding protein